MNLEEVRWSDGPAGNGLELVERVPDEEGGERGVSEHARDAKDRLPRGAVIYRLNRPMTGPICVREVLEKLRMDEQFGDLVGGKTWPELGSPTELREHVEESLTENVDEQEACHGQELGPPGCTELERDPQSE